MSHIRVLICRIDDPASDQMTELAAFDLPTPDPTTLQPDTALDDLETTTHETGNAILRRILQTQWETLDATLVEQYRQQCAPQQVTADGHEPLTVASRFGVVELSRQVCYHRDTQRHVLPANTMLPPHHGMLITRGLQEWACLLPQELPFASAARLLGWQTQEAHVLSDTTIRSLVRTHGQIIRHAEQAEIIALAAQDDLMTCALQAVPHDHSRRRAGWPAELNAAVEVALAAGQVCPPAGIGWADWERVLAARRAEASRPVEDLRHLGPTLEPDQVLLTVDEVLTPKREPGCFWELRTARIVTARGYRYVSGIGTPFLQHLHIIVLLALGVLSSLLLISDGARWIRSFFLETLALIGQKTMLLDWQHLRQKCRELVSRIGHSRDAKRQLLQRLYRRLWQGKVAAAIAVLHAYRKQARNLEALESFMGFNPARPETL